MKLTSWIWFAAFLIGGGAVVLLLGRVTSLSHAAASPVNNDPMYVARRQAIESNLHNVDTVHLAAKSWNEGKVHMWHGLGGYDSDASFTDVSEDAACQRLDTNKYKIEDGGPPIYYYKLACNGSVGYVEVDQVR